MKVTALFLFSTVAIVATAPPPQFYYPTTAYQQLYYPPGYNFPNFPNMHPGVKTNEPIVEILQPSPMEAAMSEVTTHRKKGGHSEKYFYGRSDSTEPNKQMKYRRHYFPMELANYYNPYAPMTYGYNKPNLDTLEEYQQKPFTVDKKEHYEVYLYQ